MKRLLLILFFGAELLVQGADSQLAPLIQQGLFEEEANRNLPAAIQAYEAALREFDKDRNLAATAVFRLAECFRKQGRTNEAATLYGRVTREFSDQAHLVNLSNQTLASLGMGSGAPDKPKRKDILDIDWETDRISTLIRNSPDLINAPDDSGATLLQKAASQGNLETARLLLTNGAAVNGLKEGDHTALHFASFRGHNAMVELLLASGANPNASTMSGVTPLHLAAMRGYEAVVKTLLAHKALPSATKRGTSSDQAQGLGYSLRSGETPLHLAAENGFVAVAGELLGAGAEIDAEDGDGRTALGLAAAKGHVAMVKLLLEAKANPNGGRREPPLHAACRSRNLEALRLLLQAGADPNLEPSDSLNLRPLFLAIQGNWTPGVQLLCEHKADPNVSDPLQDKSPLIFAALGRPEILKVLLDAGANPNVRNNSQIPTFPLHLAAQEAGRETELKLLLEAKADPNATDVYGRTPLHLCVSDPPGTTPTGRLKKLLQPEAERPAKMKELLAHGANVNAQTKTGDSPLHLACYSLSRPLVELLLANKADPNMLNTRNESPLDLLKREAGQLPGPGGDAPSIAKDLIEVLRQAGAREDIPRMDRIVIRCPDWPQSEVLFVTNRWNADSLSGHTLLETLGVSYGILGLTEKTLPTTGPGIGRPGIPFPDLANVRLLRPTPDWTSKTFDITAILTNNCVGDAPVQWGDVIEIPQRPHGISENWGGFPSTLGPLFAKCLACEVKVSIHGKTNSLSLGPTNVGLFAPGGPVSILAALRGSGLLLSTSDLKQVKVRRPSENKEWVVDCSYSSTDPAFWLRNGDEIEVVEKSR